MEFRFFDPSAETEMSRRNLPHWEQENAYYFITWRTADSIPAAIWDEWTRERGAWLLAHGIDPEKEDWQREVELLSVEKHQEFYRRFTARWHAMLDAGHGECVLRQPELSSIIEENLRHMDGVAYELEAFVVMPNHVHVLAGIAGRGTMKKLCKNWKHYTAKNSTTTWGEEVNFGNGRASTIS